MPTYMQDIQYYVRNNDLRFMLFYFPILYNIKPHSHQKTYPDF